MTYIIIKDSSEYQLMLDVDKALAEGFKLVGGIAVAYIAESKALFFAQAMYK